MSVDVAAGTVTEMTAGQAWAMFNRRCQAELGVDGQEFVAALDADT